MPDPSPHVKVTYTVPDRDVGLDKFGFPSPTPYVSRDYENIHYGGDIWGAATNITLNGQIYLYESERGSTLAGSPTGPDSEREANANDRFRLLNIKKDAIIRAFSDDFGILEIDDPASPESIVVGEGCIIQSVSFSSNDYSGLVDYAITLKAYELSSFEAGRKILDPVDKFSFTEGDDGFIELTHSISAKGFNTNGTATDAFANAKAFVDGRKGLANKPTTTLINNTGATPILVSLSENVDRFGAAYSVTESYRYSDDPNFNGDFLTKYTVSKDESVENGITTVSIEGEIKSKKHNYIFEGTPQDDDVTMEKIREEFKAGVQHKGQSEKIPWYEVCEADSGLDLNPYPVTFNTTEDERARVLTFNISFDNDTLFSDTDESGFNLNNAYYDFTASINTDEITSITTVGLSGLLKARGSLADRNERVDNLLGELLNDSNGTKPYDVLKAEAEILYKDITDHSEFSLDYIPSSVTITKNKFAGTISLAVQFTDKNFFPSYDIINSDYQVSLTPAMNQFRAKGSCNRTGSYMIYDVNANSREKVDISVNGRLMQFSSSDISKAKTEFKQIMDKFRDDYVLSDSKVQRLESERFLEGKHTRSLSLSSQFSCRKDDSFLTIDRVDAQPKTD
jgi:hypothetical protein